jgi:hypothetical protein
MNVLHVFSQRTVADDNRRGRPLCDAGHPKGHDNGKRHRQMDRKQKADFSQHLAGRRKPTGKKLLMAAGSRA